MTAEEIIQQWMDTCCSTIKSYDHAGHMNQISKSVQVYGIPGFEVIGYDDWFKQCEYEFNDKLVKSASYQGLKIKHEEDNKIMFLTIETINATDGNSEERGIEILLIKEEDGHWRVVQERLINAIEIARAGLM
ncbi:MAG: hypothetical protein ISR69_02645 [Gammaproteobacteria bacterium]|nr:hypothetical protein [Gammaproteobacteria bacterium]